MSSLSDRLDIGDVVAGLAHAQDDKDWNRFRELFAERVVLDASSHLGEEPVELSAEELTALAEEVVAGFPYTQHATSNLQVEIEGDHASCRAHVVAYHYFPTDGIDYCTMRGAWKLRLRRKQGGWQIVEWAVVRTIPLEGDEGLYQLAAAAFREARERGG